MIARDAWPPPQGLRGRRVQLEPLRVEHAPLLADPHLYAFIGQAPPTPFELEQRYGRQTTGRSPGGSQLWLNWVVRRLDDGPAVGTAQATVTKEGIDLVAEVAWVIATDHQGRGTPERPRS